MRTPFELAVLAVVLVLWPVFDYFVWWPRWRRRLVAGGAGARPSTYVAIALLEWALVAAAATSAVLAHRAPAEIGVVARPGVRLWIAVTACVVLGGLFVSQVFGVRRKPGLRERVRAQLARLGDAVLVLPRTRGELVGFVGVSLTAGICEEFLFRGFAIFALAAWMPVPVAAAVSCVSFGVAHSYQGVGGAVRSGLLGVVMCALYLGCGSLLPVMILHTLVDIGSGASSYFALRTDGLGEKRDPAAIA